MATALLTLYTVLQKRERTCSECVSSLLAEAGQRLNADNDRVFDVLKPDVGTPCHVIKGHVDIRDIDDVINGRRHKHQTSLFHPKNQCYDSQSHLEM